MGGFATLHFGFRHPGRALALCVGGCGYGAEFEERERFRAEAEVIAAGLRSSGMEAFAQKYAYGPTRVQFENKDPRGFAEFKAMLAQHSAVGSALTDTIGLLLAVHVHPASVQDRDGAEALLREARRSFPFIERIIGDAGYQGQKMQAAVARTGSWELQIVRRCDRHRFVVLPKRWIVERTLAWISRCRRLARDYERHARKAAAFVRLAMIRLMLRRLA